MTTLTQRHEFAPSANPRNREACAKCGRTAGNPIHESPAFALRVLRGET